MRVTHSRSWDQTPRCRSAGTGHSTSGPARALGASTAGGPGRAGGERLPSLRGPRRSWAGARGGLTAQGPPRGSGSDGRGGRGCGGASAPQRVNGGGAGQAGSCRRRGMPGAVVNAAAAPIRHGGPALLPGGSAAGLGAPGPPVLSCRAEAARVRWAWPVQLQERWLYSPLREDRPCGAGAAQPGHPPQAPAGQWRLVPFPQSRPRWVSPARPGVRWCRRRRWPFVPAGERVRTVRLGPPQSPAPSERPAAGRGCRSGGRGPVGGGDAEPVRKPARSARQRARPKALPPERDFAFLQLQTRVVCTAAPARSSASPGPHLRLLGARPTRSLTGSASARFGCRFLVSSAANPAAVRSCGLLREPARSGSGHLQEAGGVSVFSYKCVVFGGLLFFASPPLFFFL